VSQLGSKELEALRQFDTCAIANAIETFEQRLRNEGTTDASIRCMFEDMPTVVGYATTARIRSASPPPVGHHYHDRTDWWNHIILTPPPRIVVVQDMDDPPGSGAFIGEVHTHILRALGCVAYITNGAVRDLPAVRVAGFQLFAGRANPSHAFAHLVEFGGSVEVGGLAVQPGDLLCGDLHGVVSVPRAVAGKAATAAAAILRRERPVIDLCNSADFSIDKLRTLVRQLS
jgi:4-hydroxy-4-methyl-2-oxoglutarate aldolase